MTALEWFVMAGGIVIGAVGIILVQSISKLERRVKALEKQIAPVSNPYGLKQGRFRRLRNDLEADEQRRIAEAARKLED